MTRDAWRRVIGPGLIFAGTAIGTSHLIQSTRAGAMYGLALLGVIVAINVLKYPAYRFAIDYASSTRRSLLAGYRELGWLVPILFLMALAPLVPIVLAAVSAATAGILLNLAGPILGVPLLASAILAVAALMLATGGYRWLDKVTGWLLAFLVISTVATTIMVVPDQQWSTLGDISWSQSTKGLLFIVALAGFMPNPMDGSVPLSMWQVKADERAPAGERPSLGEARLAFLLPYILTTVMALCFCMMGAGLMHARGIVPLTNAPGFAGQLIELYRDALGPQAALLAAISALSVMATTVIGAVDAYVRTFAVAFAGPEPADEGEGNRRLYLFFVALFTALAALTLFTLLRNFQTFLDLVTSATFVIAPIVALFNHLVVTRCAMPESARPGTFIRAWNWIAIGLMAGLAAMFLILRLG